MKKLYWSAFVILIVATLLRLPYVFHALPFFYNEDEAHHFNRLTRMVKTGDLNPGYFHKPSLHFYLRLPVYAASFLNEVRRGGIKEVGELITKDPNGIGGYSFSASHPSIVVGQRLFSLALSISAICLSMLIIFRLTKRSAFATVVGGGLLALSPMHVELSSVIGVDVVMTFFCLLATWWSVRAVGEKRTGYLLLSAIAAGAAISSKYNALPIVLVPLIAGTQLYGREIVRTLWLACLTFLTFLACSPFIITSIPLFLNQFAYEVWHYGVAGHAGHMERPGIPQLAFYLEWLATDGVGLTALLAVGIGIYLSLRKPLLWAVAIFPLSFLALMVLQKTNFERNMLVFLPYAAIFVGLAIAWMQSKIPQVRASRPVKFLLVAFLLAQPLVITSTQSLATVSDRPDSRNELQAYIMHQQLGNVAVDAALQPHKSLLLQSGIERSETQLVDNVWLDGYDAIATGKELASRLATKLQSFGTPTTETRIVRDPLIHLYQLETSSSPAWREHVQAAPSLLFTSSGDSYTCSTTTEDYCWTTTRVSKFKLPITRRDFSAIVTVSTPWEQQAIAVLGEEDINWIPVPKGESKIRLTIPDPEFVIATKIIRSPAEFMGSDDARRLGIAVHEIAIR